jgi:hypothetical protein
VPSTTRGKGAIIVTDNDSGGELSGYAEQVLAGTGLNAADVTGGGNSAEGSAAHALKDGWEIAARAGKAQGV